MTAVTFTGTAFAEDQAKELMETGRYLEVVQAYEKALEVKQSV